MSLKKAYGTRASRRLKGRLHKPEPKPRSFRKTCEEIAHEEWVRLSKLKNDDIDKELILTEVHRLLHDQEPGSVHGFLVQDAFNAYRLQYTIVCTHRD